RTEHVDGHGYSRFCELYGEWRRRLSPTMRQTYMAGDKLFVDWAGGRVPIVDSMTGEVHEAHLFVAVLGASSYTLQTEGTDIATPLKKRTSGLPTSSLSYIAAPSIPF